MRLAKAHRTIGPRIRISLCDGESARCSASNRQDQPSASSPITLPSITLLMSSTILHPAPRSESSEAKRSRRGGLRPPPETELKLPAFHASTSSSCDSAVATVGRSLEVRCRVELFVLTLK